MGFWLGRFLKAFWGVWYCDNSAKVEIWGDHSPPAHETLGILSPLTFYGVQKDGNLAECRPFEV